MDTMDTMYKLTKQIDALTYNSRAVLNALVRSCIAAGSSNGYIVRRFGDELKLSREDIFRLYDFYQCWANGSYGYASYTNDPDEFDDIVARCDAKWTSGDQLVTKAIVTHSKILYEVSSNKDESGTDFWLGLIRDSSSPKLVTNSAPIPLNLRTPLYDADLSTKSFSQYETYLFPSGYNKLAITGMPGDGETHVGGGKSWIWDIDETLEVKAQRIVLGYHTNPVQRLENYGNTELSMSFGYETYALGERSVALGGLNGIAYGTDSATVGGRYPLAMGIRSMVGAGDSNIAVGDSSFAANYRVHSVGPYSIAVNRDTVAGDYTYQFTIEDSSAEVKVVDCEAIKDTVTGTCVVQDGYTDVIEGAGRNTVRISYNVLAASGFWDINIKAGDEVIIYAQTRRVDNVSYTPNAEQGYAYKPLHFKVVNITRKDGDFLVQLDGSIPRGESLNSMLESGGYISRYSMELGELSYSGAILDSKDWRPGESSAALNYNTFTAGVNQTVVGQMNRGERDAKFVVGTGSSYVGTNALRRNGLVVAEGYGYMQTASQSANIGVSDYAGNHYRDYDAMFVANGAWMMHSGNSNYTGYSWVNDSHTEMGLYKGGVEIEDSHLTFVRSGSSYLSSTHDVTTCLESRAGTLIINAGSYVGAEHNYDVLLQQGPIGMNTGNKGVAIYSEHGMDIRNTDEAFMMSFENSGYISAKFKGLFLEGNTWGALATTDEARSRWVYHNSRNEYYQSFGTPGHCIDYPNTIAHSGFFYGQNDWKPGKTPSTNRINLPAKNSGSWENNQGNAFHIFNSSVAYVNADGELGYDVSCLLLPGTLHVTDISNPPHPKVINSFIYGNGNGGVMPTETYVTEELAYLSDLDKLSDKSVKIDERSIVKVFDRQLADSNNMYPLPTSATTGGAFLEGVCGLAIRGSSVGYFANYPGEPIIIRPFSIVPNITGLSQILPYLRAPDDHLKSIVLRRCGALVTCSMEVYFASDASKANAKYSEFLLVLNESPLAALGIPNTGSAGISSSLVLNGAGSNGVSVTCTIAHLMGTQMSILGNTYSADNMVQFLIRNPNQVSGNRMFITLSGVYNGDID